MRPPRSPREWSFSRDHQESAQFYGSVISLTERALGAVGEFAPGSTRGQDAMAEFVIRSILENFSFVLLILAPIIVIVRGGGSAETFLSWLLLLPLGIGSLWAGISHALSPERAASFIGWQTSPFQFEVAAANLGIGLAGIMSFRASLGFKTAVVVMSAVFLLGAALVHVEDMFVAHNFAPGNAGAIFYWDIILPFALIGLLVATRHSRPS